MFTGLEMMACPNLAVSAEVMRHIVHVESNANPYAIGIVGARLLRQPRTLGEALATVHMLDAGNYNYSLGVAQINRANLEKYGLDSNQKAFMPCANLAAGAQILAGCYRSSGGDWGKAFSCYYSGNFVTGFHDGYVRKVYESINGGPKSHTASGSTPAVMERDQPEAGGPAAERTTAPAPGTGAWRIAVRSVDLIAARPVPLTPALAPAGERSAPAGPSGSATGNASIWPVAPAKIVMRVVGSTDPQPNSAFIPRVSGPNDPAISEFLPIPQARDHSPPAQTGPVPDPSNPHKEQRDAAFVF